jgi:hypothetical protein
MQAEAERLWSGGSVYFVRVWHPGDAGSYVEMRRSHAREVTMNLDQVFFDAGSGRVLHRFEAAALVSAQRFISGIHFIQFDHWALRWLYFGSGVLGCVMIATGFLVWLESRRTRHARQGLSGVRVVEALVVASVSGIAIATLCFFVANRLLPLGASLAGQDRAALEVWVFYGAWLASLAHAAWRRAEPPLQPARQAWREQCLAAAVLAMGAVALNATSTGDALPVSLARGDLAIAGMDLMLLAAALVFWRTSRMLRKPATLPGTDVLRVGAHSPNSP